MNNLPDILSLHQSRSSNASQALGNTPEPQGLFGFLNQVNMHLKSDGRDNAQKVERQVTPKKTKAFSEKVAAQLQNKKKLPPSLQGMNKKEIASKIKEVIEKNDIKELPSDSIFTAEDFSSEIEKFLKQDSTEKILPSLLSDLASSLSPELQEDNMALQTLQERKDIISKLLSLIEEGSIDLDNIETKLDFENALAAIDTKTLDTIDIKDPEIIDNSDEIVFKDESTPHLSKTNMLAEASRITEVLQEMQGDQVPTHTPLDPSVLQNLKERVHELVHSPVPFDKDIIAEFKQEIVQGLKALGIEPAKIDRYLAELSQSFKKEIPALEGINIAENKANKEIQDLPLLKTPEEIISAEDSEELNKLTEKAKELIDTKKTDKTNVKEKAAVEMPVAPQQSNTQNTTKTAPQNTAAMINALAQGDTNFFEGENFGSGTQGQHSPEILNNSAFLKSGGLESIGTQNFGQYLSNAKSAHPSTTTQMIQLQLQRSISNKINSMTLQLEPADLGRMDVELKFLRDGQIRAHLTVERPETLALLQKDSHHLEKVLQQSGLNTDQNSLSFDLKKDGQQNAFGEFNNQNGNNGEEFAGYMDGSVQDNTIETNIATYAMQYISHDSVNITI